MLYTLPNGNTIEISVEAYLSFTDEDLTVLHASNSGSGDLPAFHSSVLRFGEKKSNNKTDFSGVAFDISVEVDFIEEEEPDLDDTNSRHLRGDLDYTEDND